MEGIEQLQQLGLSQYEAQAYVTLLRESPLNGYELAKASGVPRANIYAVLHKLEEAGAVMRLTSPDGNRYVPVPSDEFLSKLKRRYQQSVDTASARLRQISAPPNLESILNVRGYAALLDQAQALLDRAGQHLLLSIWPEEASALARPLQDAWDRGVRITTLCLRGCPQPCPACRGAVFRYALASSEGKRWLILVADGDELLAGEIHAAGGTETQGANASAVAVRTRQNMLVNLTGYYIQNSIALASILTGLGDRLYTELDPQTIAALKNLHPLHEKGEWLEVMRRMLRLDQNVPE